MTSFEMEAEAEEVVVPVMGPAVRRRCACRSPVFWVLAVELVVLLLLLLGWWATGGGTADPEDSRPTEGNIWKHQNDPDPARSHIKAGSPKGVVLVLGQSLNRDGTVPQVLVDRAKKAKTLLGDPSITKVIVSGGDPHGTGKTEAFQMKKVLVENEIDSDDIILESQALTTAENLWFALRWLPEDTGQLHVITSDFHMPRAKYIIRETLNHFYSTFELEGQKYPRLTLHWHAVLSYCSEASSRDAQKNTGINAESLAQRATNELGYLASLEVNRKLDGEHDKLYAWPVQIEVRDKISQQNLREALVEIAFVVKELCHCSAAPESRKGDKNTNPLPVDFSKWDRQEFNIMWEDAKKKCDDTPAWKDLEVKRKQGKNPDSTDWEGALKEVLDGQSPENSGLTII